MGRHSSFWPENSGARRSGAWREALRRFRGGAARRGIDGAMPSTADPASISAIFMLRGARSRAHGVLARKFRRATIGLLSSSEPLGRGAGGGKERGELASLQPPPAPPRSARPRSEAIPDRGPRRRRGQVGDGHGRAERGTTEARPLPGPPPAPLPKGSEDEDDSRRSPTNQGAHFHTAR